VQQRMAERRMAAEAHGERKVRMAQDGLQQVGAVELAYPLFEQVDEEHARRTWDGGHVARGHRDVVREQQLGERHVARHEGGRDGRQARCSEVGIGTVVEQEAHNVHEATHACLIERRAGLSIALVVHRRTGGQEDLEYLEALRLLSCTMLGLVVGSRCLGWRLSDHC